MHLIQPGHHAFIGGILMLSLILIGILSLISFIHGTDLMNKNKALSIATSYRVLGTFGLCFVLYNFINYNYIHSNSANQIVGTFQSTDTKSTLIFHKNQTWEMHGKTFTVVSGTWEHHITEDVAPYWNLDSKKSLISEQIFNCDTINFKSKNLTFIRTN